MPIAHRRPGLLHLVLPHPALDQPAPSPTVASPHTPRRATRLVPEPHTRSSIASSISDRPRSSIDSWNSVDTNEIAWEWKEEELELLSRTLDNIPSHLMTPYVGVIPPPNVLDKLARNVASSRSALDWPHSVRATRVKLHELCRRKTVQKAIERHAPTMRVPTQVAEPRRPLYRQSSMDFLPVKNEATSVTRLSSRLQRTDRTVPHASFHPYARPSGSRTPTPPPIETPNHRSSTPEDSPMRAPSPRKLFRSSATPPPQSLKRTPSFSAAAVKTRTMRSSAPPESPPYSSDEEEKAREATAKRPRTTRRVPSFLGAPLPALAPSPEEEILDPLVGGPEDLVFAPTIPAVKRKSLPPPPRPRPSVPVTPAPVMATPRTLRRIGTRNFPPPSSVAALARAMALPSPAIEAPQPRRVSAPRSPVVQPRPVPSASDEQRRRERKSRREDKESQPTLESTRKPKKKSTETKPSLASMRL